MNGAWHISLRFHPDALRHGIEPLDLLMRLESLADSIQIATVDDGLPPLGELDPQSCLLGFEISLVTGVTRAEIEAVFEDAGEDCTVRLFPPTRRASDLVELLRELPQEGRLGDILVECGAISRQSLDEALDRQTRLRKPDATAPEASQGLEVLALADRLNLNLAIAGSPNPGAEAALEAARSDARRLQEILRNPDHLPAFSPGRG